MIPTSELKGPYRQATEHLCGIAAYATAVRPFCDKELEDFLRDFWKQYSVAVGTPNMQDLCQFYEDRRERLFNAFPWDGTGSKMFKWLGSLQGPTFHDADINCSFLYFPSSGLAALESQLQNCPAVACISTAFEHCATLLSHIVNVWFDGREFCLRDSAQAHRGSAPTDGTGTTLNEVVAHSGIFQRHNGHIVAGMVVTRRN